MHTETETWMLPCLYKKFLGINCPGCGFQRSLVYLLEGRIEASIMMYPALLPTFLMLIFLVVHIKYRISGGHKVLLGLFVVNTILISGNYILKNFI